MYMKREIKYAIIGLVVGATLVVALYFVLGKKKEEFIVTFDSAGGSSIPSQLVVEKERVIKPDNPTKENYNFLRWEYQNKEYDFTSEVISDMTLKAIWEEIKEEEQYYDLEFTVDGVTKKLSLSKVLTEKDLEELGFEEKDGYEIIWYINDEEYDFTEPLSLTENMSITGKYVKTTMYTIKFNSNGGDTVSSQKVKQNGKATEPEAISKHGYIFDGWYLGNTKYDFASPVTKNITLVAKWKEDASVKRYEVTFDTDGGNKIDKQRVVENEKATEPKKPTKDGYKFVEWQLNEKKYDFKTKVTANITLKAKWEKIIQYEVTFDSNNGSNNTIKKVNSGSKVSKPNNPTKAGHKFVYWLLDNEKFDFNTPITKNITLIAHYEKLPDPTPTPTPVKKYKMIATRADRYSPASILKLYLENDLSHEISFSTITVGGKTVNPHPSINTDALKEKLNGSNTLVVKLSDGTEVTAQISFVES